MKMDGDQGLPTNRLIALKIVHNWGIDVGIVLVTITFRDKVTLGVFHTQNVHVIQTRLSQQKG